MFRSSSLWGFVRAALANRTIVPVTGTQSYGPDLTTEEAGKFALPSAWKRKCCAEHMARLGRVTYGVKVLNRISPMSQLERDNKPNRKMG